MAQRTACDWPYDQSRGGHEIDEDQIDPQRLELATAFDGDRAINPLQEGAGEHIDALKASGTDRVVDASGAQGERTAHTVLGGMDPVATFTQYAARVGYVHMKDIAARRNPGEPWLRRIRELGDLIVHVCAHDYDGTRDHVELGSGQVDVDEVICVHTRIHNLSTKVRCNPNRHRQLTFSGASATTRASFAC